MMTDNDPATAHGIDFIVRMMDSTPWPIFAVAVIVFY